MTEIVPAIIPKNFSHLKDEVAKIKDFVNLVQVDVADGLFVKNKSWPYLGDEGEFQKLISEELGLPSWEDVDYEFHLMVKEPEKVVEDWIKVGASGIIVQVETISDESFENIATLCKANEIILGLSIKPSTNNERLVRYIELIDFIQCMGSDNLGRHGVELDSAVFEKIRTLRGLYPSMPIAVDIGVNEDTAQDLIDAGATKLVAGSAIYESGDVHGTIEFFRGL